MKRKLLSRTPGLRGSLATTARAELPRPMAPGEAPPAPEAWHDDLLADNTDV